eukprot:3293696-Pleurochrysis_carterae.AAC.2
MADQAHERSAALEIMESSGLEAKFPSHGQVKTMTSSCETKCLRAPKRRNAQGSVSAGTSRTSRGPAERDLECGLAMLCKALAFSPAQDFRLRLL